MFLFQLVISSIIQHKSFHQIIHHTIHTSLLHEIYQSVSQWISALPPHDSPVRLSPYNLFAQSDQCECHSAQTVFDGIPVSVGSKISVIKLYVKDSGRFLAKNCSFQSRKVQRNLTILKLREKNRLTSSTATIDDTPLGIFESLPRESKRREISWLGATVFIIDM